MSLTMLINRVINFINIVIINAPNPIDGNGDLTFDQH